MPPKELPLKMRYLFSSLRIIWLLLTILTIVVFIQPVNARMIRLFIVLSTPVVLIGACALLWKHRLMRWITFIVLPFMALILILPSRGFDANSLREGYCRRLRTYENVPYVWGGENHKGIDCSGLVRQALFEANLRRGIITATPSMLQSAFRLWWTDFPAKALIDRERNLAKVLFEAESVNSAGAELLEAGDLAVTKDGVHVMVYLGGSEWIAADPGVGRVIRVTAPVVDNIWFEKPVILVRWNALDSE